MTICFDTYWQMDNLPNDLAERIRANLFRLMQKKGWNQAQLADAADVEPATVNRAINGKLRMVTESLSKMALALGVDPSTMLSEHANVEPIRLKGNLVPVLDYIQAGNFAGVAPSFRDAEMTNFVPTGGGHSEDTFALTIRGESMLPEFREGDVVIIDPAVAPQPGDFVVAKEATGGEATFKQFKPRGINDLGKSYFVLEPLNKDYEPMRSDFQQIKIVGTMMEHHRYRRR